MPCASPSTQTRPGRRQQAERCAGADRRFCKIQGPVSIGFVVHTHAGDPTAWSGPRTAQNDRPLDDVHLKHLSYSRRSANAINMLIYSHPPIHSISHLINHSISVGFPSHSRLSFSEHTNNVLMSTVKQCIRYCVIIASLISWWFLVYHMLQPYIITCTRFHACSKA